MIAVAIVVASAAVFAMLRPKSPTYKTASWEPELTKESAVQERMEAASSFIVTEPVDGAVVNNEKITVAGTVTDGLVVTVNDEPAEIHDGTFTATAFLEEGKNKITVKTSDWEDKTSSVTLNVTRVSETAQTPSILLSGRMFLSDAQLNWETTAVDTSKGFYVMHSTSPNPTYPEDFVTMPYTNKYEYTQNSILDGKVHYFRLCQVASQGKCGVYSNEVALLGQIASHVDSIKLTKIESKRVHWTFSTQSFGGFTLLWSQTPNPSYPGDSSVSASTTPNPIVTYMDIGGTLESGKTYYVKVCENIGGACGTYSNEFTLVAP